MRSEKCVVCQDGFSSKGNFRRHMLQSHRVSKDLKKCPMCSYVTRRANNLARHCLLKHEGKMDSNGYIKCEKCTKVFASPSLLQSHKGIAFLYDSKLINFATPKSIFFAL